VLTSAATNAPRFDYNPSTLAAQGLLIEESRANLLTYSAEFNDAAWSKFDSSITANATTSPDGTLTADKLVDTTANALHYTVRNITVTANTNYAWSVFVKASEYSRVRIRFGKALTPFTRIGIIVNLNDGSFTNSDVGTPTSVAVRSVTPVGNGWYRVAVAGIFDTTSTDGYVEVTLVDNAGNTTFTGTGTSGLFLWGAQLEAGAFPTSYIPTTTTALTRAADVASVNTLSPWYNAIEGTIFAEATNPVASIYRIIAEPGTASDFRDFTLAFDGLRTDFANRTQAFTGNDVLSPAGSLTAGSTVKVAGAYTASVTRHAYNGLVASNTTNVAQRAVADRLWFGSRTGSTAFLNGYLRRVTYYPRALSTAELQAITA
jgi:hypothetical protein